MALLDWIHNTVYRITSKYLRINTTKISMYMHTSLATLWFLMQFVFYIVTIPNVVNCGFWFICRQTCIIQRNTYVYVIVYVYVLIHEGWDLKEQPALAGVNT